MYKRQASWIDERRATVFWERSEEEMTTTLNIILKSNERDASLLAPSDQERAKAEAWLNHHVELAEQAGEPFSKIVALTPVLARLLLDRNPENRYISRRKIREYIRDIEDGNYELNGETIKISNEGLLNDGQHRCHAVIETGKSIKTFIAFGLTRESRGTVDQGKARTAGDFFRIDGVDDSNVAAAVTSLIYQYLDKGFISTHQDHRPTRQQLREFFNKDDKQNILASIDFVGRKGLKPLGGRSAIAFCHFILAANNRQSADHFIGKLITGEELSRTDPIYKCRERLINGRRLSVHEKAKLIFQAWTAFREGRVPTRLIMAGALPDLWGAK